MDKISVSILGGINTVNAFESDGRFEVASYTGRCFPLITGRPEGFPQVKASEVPTKNKNDKASIARAINGVGRKALIKTKGDWAVVDGVALAQTMCVIRGKGNTACMQLPPQMVEAAQKLVETNPAFAGYVFETVDAAPNYTILMKDVSVFLRKYWGKNIVILDLPPAFISRDKDGKISATKYSLEDEDHRRTALKILRNLLGCELITVPCELMSTGGVYSYTPEAYGYIVSRVRTAISGGNIDPAALDEVYKANAREYPALAEYIGGDRDAQAENLKALAKNKGKKEGETAFQTARCLSFLGIPESFYYLGIMFNDGKVTKKNKARAIYYQRKAVRAGVVPARNELFNLLWTEDKAYDIEMVNAIKSIYTKKGKTLANMAKAYLYGRGVPKDLAMAEKLYREAESMKDGDPSLGILDALWAIGSPASLNELHERCKDSEAPKARIYLARLLAQGSVVPKDIETAKEILKACISEGYAEAEDVYAEITENDGCERKAALADIVSSDLVSFDRHLLYIGEDNPALEEYAASRNMEYVTVNFTKHRMAYLVLDMNKLTESQKFPYDALIDRKGNDRTLLLCDYSVLDEKRKKYLKIVLFRLLAKHPGIHVVHTDVDDVAERIDEVIVQHEEKTLSDFEVRTVIDGNVLKSSITIGSGLIHLKSVFKYRFQVFCDNVLVHDAPIQDTPLFERNVDQDGLYSIKGFVIRDVCESGRYSNAVGYFTDGFKEKADAILDGEADFERISIRPQKKPFQDMVLHVVAGGKNIDDIMAKEGLKNFVTTDIRNIGTVRLYAENSVSTTFQSQSFSGIYRYNDRIVTDGSSNVTVGNSDYGCFTCLRYNRRFNTVVFFKDFCSYGRIFMYRDGDEYIFSNRYIRLVKTLKDLGKTLTFDKEKALVSLSSDDRLLMQNFTHGMDIREIEQLDPCGQVHVSFKGVVTSNNTEVYNVLQDRQYTRDSQYERILGNANKEIKENIASALKTFGKVEEEVNGGLDSRCVLSAVNSMKVPKTSVELCVDTEDPAETAIAVKVGSISGYPFSESKVKATVLDAAETEMECRNHYLGTLHTYNVPKVRLDNMVCRLTGGTGNAFCRPEYSRYHFGDVGELSKDAHEMADAVWQHLCEELVIDSADAGRNFIERLTEELNRVDINNPVGKYDMLYFYYRNGYLFDPYMDAINNRLMWMPLQSAELFRAYNQTHDSFRNSRMEIEMIASMMPALADVEFDSESDTEVYDEVYDDLFASTEDAPNVDMDKAVSEWGKANGKRGYDLDGTIPAEDEDIASKLMDAIKVLAKLDGGYYRKAAGYALVHYALRNADDKTVLRNLYRKIVSIIDQYTLIE